MRQKYSIFTTLNSAITGTVISGTDGCAAITIDNHIGGKVLILVNPSQEAFTYTLSGEWNVIADGMTAGTESLSKIAGVTNVPAYSVMILVNDHVLAN